MTVKSGEYRTVRALKDYGWRSGRYWLSKGGSKGVKDVWAVQHCPENCKGRPEEGLSRKECQEQTVADVPYWRICPRLYRLDIQHKKTIDKNLIRIRRDVLKLIDDGDVELVAFNLFMSSLCVIDTLSHFMVIVNEANIGLLTIGSLEGGFQRDGQKSVKIDMSQVKSLDRGDDDALLFKFEEGGTSYVVVLLELYDDILKIYLRNTKENRG